MGRPVKFFEDRTENYLHTTHGRDHYTDIEIGATPDGKITALIVGVGGFLVMIGLAFLANGLLDQRQLSRIPGPADESAGISPEPPKLG